LITFCFCVVKTPDTSNRSTPIIIKFGMIANPYSNHILFELFDFVGVSFRGLMGEIMRKFHLLNDVLLGQDLVAMVEMETATGS